MKWKGKVARMQVEFCSTHNRVHTYTFSYMRLHKGVKLKSSFLHTVTGSAAA